MSNTIRTVEVFVGDTALGLSAQLLVNGLPQDLTAASVVSRIKPTGGVAVETAMTIVHPHHEGRITRELGDAEVAIAREATLEFVVTFASGKKATWPSPSEEPTQFIVRTRRT